MKQDQSIAIQLVGDNDQQLLLSNVLVEAHFFTGGNFRYSFKIGRTDKNGTLSANYFDIERIRHRNALENLMDYNTKLDDCDSTLKVVVPSRQALQQQRDSAVRFYQAPPEWAKVWPVNLKQHESSVQLSGQMNIVRIHLDSDEVPVGS